MNGLAAALGTRWPLIQAPMAGVQDSRLAIAVTEAGGLGSLPAAMLTVVQLTQELELLKQHGGVFNLNFFCHTPPYADDPAQAERDHAAYQALLAPYYAEFGIDASSIVAGGGREPFAPSHAALVEQFKPRVLSFHFGLPKADLLQRVKAAGCLVLSSATTLDEALWLEAHGADAVIAQGIEAGGHRATFLQDPFEALATQPATLELVRACAQRLRVPVVAAGGITQADDVRAALAAGAAGVQAGTAYLLANEATTSAPHRRAIERGAAEPSVHQTAPTNLFSGRPARGIFNRVMRELGAINRSAPQFPNATAAIAPLRAAAQGKGLDDFTPLWSGSRVAGVRAAPAAEITHALAAGF